MTIEEALNILDTVFQDIQLNDTQESVFRQSWAGLTYQEIAQELNFATEYIRAVGAQLWNSLSDVFGERVTKQNVRSVLERWARHNLGIACRPPVSPSRQDWGEAIDVSTFFGRSDELATLEQWIVQDRCRIVALLGMGGIGKTSLSIKLARHLVAVKTEEPEAKSERSDSSLPRLTPHFNYVIWRSLRNAPPLLELLTSLLQFFADGDTELPTTVDEQLSRLIQQLRDRRCLLILDNVEAVLGDGEGGCAGHYRDGYEDYGTLFRQVGDVPHQSCLIVTSREKPRDIDVQEGVAVRSLHLRGLTRHEAQEMFKIRGPFTAAAADWTALIEHYAGNPLALKIVAATIQDLFDRDVAKFLTQLQQGPLVFDDIRDLLQRQFDRLSDDEETILNWLAINREVVSLADLQADIVSPVLKRRSLEAVKSLGRRSLIDRTAKGFTLQPVVMEYLTERLVERAAAELCAGQIRLWMNHAFVKAQAKSYVRDSQIRLILEPIADRLCDHWHSTKQVERNLQHVLATLQTDCSHTPGYAAGNVLNLLCHLQVDLTGYDFSHLAVWQAYLQGVTLHRVNFAHADLSRSVFLESIGDIWAVALSPDGTRLAASDTLNGIHLWQVSDGKKLLTCRGHTDWCSNLAFSPDGSRFASGSNDTTIKLWDTHTGTCLHTLQGHEDWMLSVVFSPDGRWLASSSADRTIRVWDTQTGVLRRRLQGHDDWVRGVAFVRVGEQSLLVSGSADDTIKLWNLDTGDCVQTWRAESQGVWAIVLSPDGHTLATAGTDASLKQWNVATGQWLRTLRGHTGCVRSLAYSADGVYLVSGSEDQTVRIWDSASGDCLRVLHGHRSAVWSIACSRPHLLASGSVDQRVRLWNPRTGQCLSTLQGYLDAVWAIALTQTTLDQTTLDPAIPLLASGSTNHTIKLWNAHTGDYLRTLQGHTKWVLSVAFSRDGSCLASSSVDHTIRLWDTGRGACQRILRGHSNWVLSVKFSPDDRTLASTSFDQTLRLWDRQTGECLSILRGHKGRVWSVAYSADGDVLASSGEDHTVRLWHSDTGECLQILRGHTGRIWSVLFSPVAPLLASAGDDRTLRLWDSHTGECIRVLEGHTQRVQSVAFSPDGQCLASGSADGTVKLWNPFTGECLHTLSGHSNRVWSVAFGTSDRLLLASGSEDETIRIWDSSTGECLRTLRGPRPYQDLNITGIQGLTEAQKATLYALGAVELS